MWLVNLLSTLATTGLFLAANAVAAPITFQIVVPNATGVNNLVPFANQTVAITVRADTSQITPVANIVGGAGPGNCVPAISTSLSVGGSAALQAVAPVYFCSTLTASVAGVFTTANAAVGTWYFIADYSNAGITNFALASNFPLTSNVPGHTASTATPLNLAGGGTASITAVPPVGATLAAFLGAAIPTLGEVGLAALAVLVAFAGVAALWQRKRA